MAIEVSNTIMETFSITLCVFCVVICLPIALYYYIKFDTNSDSMIIQKRYPGILRLSGLCELIAIGFAFPMCAMDWAGLDQLAGIQQTMDRYNQCIWPWFTQGFYTLCAWRFWHIYFDLKYSSSQKNSEWKYHLDPSLVAHNFWLSHKKDYGSALWLRKYVLIYYFSSVLVSIITYQIVVGTDYFLTGGHMFAGALHFIPSTAAFVIWFKVPSYSDHFFIKEEMKKISVLLCVITGIAMGCFAIALIFPVEFFMLTVVTICAVLYTSVLLVSFFAIPKKIKAQQIRTRLMKLIKNKDESSNSNTSTMNQQAQLSKIVDKLTSTIDSTSQGSKKSYKLHNIISTERSFKLFMQHLAKEFSTECLLCFVEIVQYKFAVKKRYDIVNPSAIESKMNVNVICPLETVAPLSIINRKGFQDVSKYSLNDDESTLMGEAKKVCLKFFRKYIEAGSELQVNLSFEDRIRLSNLMSHAEFFMKFKITPNELFCMYDAVATSMFRLMAGSFARFKQQNAFKTACKEVDEHKIQTVSVAVELDTLFVNLQTSETTKKD